MQQTAPDTDLENRSIAIWSMTTLLITYGMYMVLFALAVIIMLGRKRAGYKWHLTSLILMMLSSNAQVIVFLWGTGMVLSGSATVKFNNLVLLPFFFSDVVADVVMIHRCYLVWGSRKRIIVLPVIGLLVNIVSSILQLTTQPAFIWLFLFVAIAENVLLTGLTAGRIWWISRTVRTISGSGPVRYKTIAAIILESGMIYPTFLVLIPISLGLRPTFRQVLMYNVLITPQPQILGITQCLLIVRIALGVDIQDTESAVMNLTLPTINTSAPRRFSVQPPMQFARMGTVDTVQCSVPQVDIRFSSELRGISEVVPGMSHTKSIREVAENNV